MKSEPNLPINILIADDDREFVALVDEFLSVEGGFKLTSRYDGPEGVRAAIAGDFDIIILDVGLPGLNGFDSLKALRKFVDTPVVMLTARGDHIDRILGLELGADDYVSKPCNLRELVARIRAILRRLDRIREAENSSDCFVLGDIKMERGSQSVFLDNELVPLTGTEYLVLDTLVQSAGQIVGKDVISRAALGRRCAPLDRSVDVHIGNLRRKLGPLVDGRQRIKTVRGKGYFYVVAMQ